MEELVKPYDKERMKMAMLKHEEIFREQVYELHRLYRIQKTLMKNMPRNEQKRQNIQENWSAKNATCSNYMNDRDLQKKPQQNNFLWERPDQKEYAVTELRLDDDGGFNIEDESEIQLTLGPTSYCRRRKKSETPLTSDSVLSFSTSSTGSSRTKRGDRTRENVSTTHKWGLVEGPGSSSASFISGRKNSTDVEERLRQDRLKQPSWLYQVVSLNMT